jgi:FkbM family methyltransferase
LIIGELPASFGLSRLRNALTKITNRKTAIDIGAHKGIWTKVMMDEFDSVHSFEPIVSNYLTLKEINPDSYNVGLGEEESVAYFEPGYNSGMWHITDNATEFVSEIKPLDSYHFDDVDFIKIDVEGYELHVLKGAIETIAENKPAILLEENGLLPRYNVTHNELWKFMKRLGYKNTDRFQDDYFWEPR